MHAHKNKKSLKATHRRRENISVTHFVREQGEKRPVGTLFMIFFVFIPTTPLLYSKYCDRCIDAPLVYSHLCASGPTLLWRTGDLLWRPNTQMSCRRGSGESYLCYVRVLPVLFLSLLFLFFCFMLLQKKKKERIFNYFYSFMYYSWCRSLVSCLLRMHRRK